eukprot:5950069-Amphidinium_carterae.1
MDPADPKWCKRCMQAASLTSIQLLMRIYANASGQCSLSLNLSATQPTSILKRWLDRLYVSVWLQ